MADGFQIRRAKDARVIRQGIADAKTIVAKACTISRGKLRVPLYEGAYGRAHARTFRRELGKKPAVVYVTTDNNGNLYISRYANRTA